MYKFKSYMMAMLAVGSMAFLTSCGDDEENPKPAPNVVLSGTHTGEHSIAAGTPINTTVTVTSSSKITSVITTYSYDGGQEVPMAEYSEADVDETNYVIYFSEASRNVAGTEKYTFKVTNKDGQTTTKSITITTTGASTNNGQIYNLAGQNKGAWDLVANAEKAITDADADKDMINTTPTTGSNVGAFVKGWKAGNSTMFVEYTGSYDNATAAQIQSAYDAGTPANEVSNVAADKMYVAKLRGGNQWALIKVTAVEDDNKVPANGGNNLDNIKFTYKKF